MRFSPAPSSLDLTDATAAGRALLQAANASAQRTALGLGSAALATVGTSAGQLHANGAAVSASTIAASGTVTLSTIRGTSGSDINFQRASDGLTVMRVANGATVKFDYGLEAVGGIIASVGGFKSYGAVPAYFFSDANLSPVILGASSNAGSDTGNIVVSAVAHKFRSTATVAGLVFSSLFTPASSTAAGTAGTFALDANYLYACTAINTWKRSALSAF